VRVFVRVFVRDDVRLLDFDRDFERDFDCVEEGVLLYDIILVVDTVGVNVDKLVVVTFGDDLNKYDEDGLADDVADGLDVAVFDELLEIDGVECAPIIAAAPRIARIRNFILTIISL
jgi:hypothetical protein